MRVFLYLCAGICAANLGGLVIGWPFGHPLLTSIGAVMGLIVAAIRKSTTIRRRNAGPGLGLCDPCYAGDHVNGIPCPIVNPAGSDCLCSRCSPFIGRYAPEDSPSYVRDYDQD